jgi:hypothetical protein
MELPTLVTLAVEFVGGLVLLFFGKRLFYPFVAIAGFTLGYLAAVALLGPFGWPGLILSLVMAAIALCLAFVARHLLVRLVGVLVGALTAITLYSLLQGLFTALLGVSGAFLFLPVLTVLGGVAGFLLSLRAFDLALMILSSLLGADAIAAVLQTAFTLPSLLVTPVIFGLFFAGLAYQSGFLASSSQRTRTTHP